ncbi:hypothetical protein KKE45_02900 [Patescibacteria group bacterium]|nr:hypothetical protein [Patescibacteria group bacterium]
MTRRYTQLVRVGYSCPHPSAPSNDYKMSKNCPGKGIPGEYLGYSSRWHVSCGDCKARDPSATAVGSLRNWS